jgi:hypothetical protein
MRAHFTLMPRVRSMCCSPSGRCRAGTPCSLTTWLAMAYCSIPVVLFRLYSLRDSLFKECLKTKILDADNPAKMWQDCEGMLARWSTFFVRQLHFSQRIILKLLARRETRETLCDINRPLKPVHVLHMAVVLPPFPITCPGAPCGRTACLCYACSVPMRPAAHSGLSVSLPCTR